MKLTREQLDVLKEYIQEVASTTVGTHENYYHIDWDGDDRVSREVEERLDRLFLGVKG